MDMRVPLQKKKRISNRHKDGREKEFVQIREIFYFLIFYFSNLIYQIYENLTVGFRRDKHEKCSTRRGLRVGTKNMGFHREFR